MWLRCHGDVRVYQWPFLALKKLEKSDPALRAAMTVCSIIDLIFHEFYSNTTIRA